MGLRRYQDQNGRLTKEGKQRLKSAVAENRGAVSKINSNLESSVGRADELQISVSNYAKKLCSDNGDYKKFVMAKWDKQGYTEADDLEGYMSEYDPSYKKSVDEKTKSIQSDIKSEIEELSNYVTDTISKTYDCPYDELKTKVSDRDLNNAVSTVKNAMNANSSANWACSVYNNLDDWVFDAAWDSGLGSKMYDWEEEWNNNNR